MTNEELVLSYQEGNKQALNKIIELNMRIIYKLANKFYINKTNSIDKEDLIQEGFMGLIIAADKYRFHIDNQAKFITYAIYWIYQKINRFVNTKNTNEESSLNIPVGDDGDIELMDYIEGVDYSFENIEEKIYNQELREELNKVMDETLTLKEKEILKLRHGWDNNKCMTYDEIGELLNARGGHVKDVANRAYKKIRHTPWGNKKAMEVFKNIMISRRYNYSSIDNNISFAQRYL